MKKEKSINNFKHVFTREVIFNGYPGSDVKDAVDEVFEWFYANQVNKVILDNVNGAKVTMEWKRETESNKV
jgi:hypothetical protein